MKYTISNNCVFFESDGHFIIDNFIKQEQRALKSKYIYILTAFTSPVSLDEAINRSTRMDIDIQEFRYVFNQLLNFGALVRFKNSHIVDKYSIDSLSTANRYFYYNSKTNEASIYENSVDELIDLSSRKHSRPKSFKEYPGAISINLKDPHEKNELLSVLLNRRSIRNTDPNKEVTLDELSKLLYFSMGMTGQTLNSPIGNVVFRPVATPGGRSSIESYVIVDNESTSNLVSGIYHYNIHKNSLELLKKGHYKNKVSLMTGDQPHALSSSVFLLFTSRLDRMIWKYKEAAAITAPYVELGSIIQNQYLISEELGLGCCYIGAKRDSQFETLLQLDNKVESYLGLMSIGKILTNLDCNFNYDSRFYRPDLEKQRREHKNNEN